MFLTPLLIHRKLPVTARTAGRCDRPEAPPATPAFILLYLQSVGLPSVLVWTRVPAAVSDFRHTAPTKAEVGFSVGTEPPRPHSPDTTAHRAKQGRNCWGSMTEKKWFLLCQRHRNSGGRQSYDSSLCPSALGPQKWARASARNCARRIAGRDACPAERQEISTRILCKQHT